MTPNKPAYFIHDPSRETWQLQSGNGMPITAPRTEADDAWRAAVLRLTRTAQKTARVRSGERWIGTVDSAGRFTPSDDQAEQEANA